MNVYGGEYHLSVQVLICQTPYEQVVAYEVRSRRSRHQYAAILVHQLIAAYSDVLCDGAIPNSAFIRREL
ncbi:MAG: hypothetical protein EZS28_038919 [Streblomastix strix]|uniref:Uncharacterized protein n=1 Tax=Streblomastix strix TaxID=222440 RepID=A0A5J4U5N2_9EUKA|nr:MAG: hypothetical protein EZS28_038919 [Streblomastix strix]